MKKVRKQHFGSTIKGKITIYDKLYTKMNEAEKREFLSQLWFVFEKCYWKI